MDGLLFFLALFVGSIVWIAWDILTIDGEDRETGDLYSDYKAFQDYYDKTEPNWRQRK